MRKTDRGTKNIMVRLILILLGIYITYAITSYYWEKHKQNKILKDARRKKVMRDLKRKASIPKSDDWYKISKEDRIARVDKLNKLISRIIVKDPKLAKDATFISECLKKDVLTTNDKKRLNKLWKDSK